MTQRARKLEPPAEPVLTLSSRRFRDFMLAVDQLADCVRELSDDIQILKMKFLKNPYDASVRGEPASAERQPR